ncbi:nucleoside hydrolase [Streptomyces sp. NPDC056669]|uniref:nucleoside hydrolase n=1 Tax=unclassified Streptomyces TaxID=2593676 RepID=UPI00368430DD
MVIDTDPGVDDTWAILFLAAQPDVEIVAVGAAHGNVPTAVAAANALRVLDVAGLDQVPVAVGHPAPLQQSLRTAEFVHGEDGLGGKAGPASPREVSPESAAEQLVRLARQRPGELTLLALAPLTNIVLALRLEPSLPRLLRRVVFMGGAFHVAGNVSAWAEANSAHDPEAAEEVLRAGFDLIVLGASGVPRPKRPGRSGRIGRRSEQDARCDRRPAPRRVAGWILSRPEPLLRDHAHRSPG